MTYLDFEKEIKNLGEKIKKLEEGKQSAGTEAKREKLRAKLDEAIIATYAELSPWERVQVARHPERPHSLDYIRGMAEGFVELCGDRMFADDRAIVGGIGRINGMPAMIIGQEKGGDTDERIRHNFGAPKPEGYRKALRLMELADKFALPVVTLVDTSGAFPGFEAEERGQSQAIAASIQKCLDLSVPSVCVVIGEGGSGGAIAIAVANSVFMLENSVYSVISPEGCASILWREAKYKEEAAKALKLTADDLKELRIIDNIIAEPAGGAHRHKDEMVARVKAVVSDELKRLVKLGRKKSHEARIEKYEKMTRL